MVRENSIKKPFTDESIKNRELMLEMLRFEDKYYFSEQGQDIMRDIGKNNLFSLDACKTIQRITLCNFGFTSTDEDLSKYRTIFYSYYNSAVDYDKDILESVYYMRENRLLYYTTKKLLVGDKAIDTNLLEIDGKTETTLFNILKEQPSRTNILCSFSLSWPPFMMRLNKICDIIPKLCNSKYRLIFVQINEAHSKQWSLGFSNQPNVHKTLSDRVIRANEFVGKLQGIKLDEMKDVVRVVIDPWGDEFEQIYQSWPDQYYILTPEKIIIKKSEYSVDAVIIEDYINFLYDEMK